MHVIFREGWQDDDYLHNHCVGANELRDRVMGEYSPEVVSRITGISVADITTFATEYANSMKDRGGPGLIRLNYGLQRHGGGAMAVRTIVCLPALTGDWRHAGGGALLSTSKAYPFDNHYLERPDLIPRGTRTINMTSLAAALHGELPGPPVKALFVYNSNPAAIAPDQSRVLSGLRREDLFTVVHELFQTDTADYADIVLPATSQLEHFDIHNSYGHLYVQSNNAAIAPLGESKPNTDVFRLLAAEMGFEPELFAETDEEMAAKSMGDSFGDITFADTKAGPVRLNLPPNWAPFAEGKFPTPSGKCEIYSEREKRAGRDPLPHYIPPHEDPQTRPDLAEKYPLQMVCPPAASFLNSSFVNIDVLRKSAVEPTLEIHPTDAASRSISDGAMVSVFNDRGRFRARAIVGETVKPGWVVSLGVWWNKLTADGVNCNTTTSTALTDQGGGATFFDNLVEVAAVRV
jgi:anaerobic selenocysteine-containing dehydrogenase